MFIKDDIVGIQIQCDETTEHTQKFILLVFILVDF